MFPGDGRKRRRRSKRIPRVELNRPVGHPITKGTSILRFAFMTDVSDDSVVLSGLVDMLEATMGRLRLFCGKCWAEGRFDPHGRSGLEPSVREDAARHFARLGWCLARTAICPSCAKTLRD